MDVRSLMPALFYLADIAFVLGLDQASKGIISRFANEWHVGPVVIGVTPTVRSLSSFTINNDLATYLSVIGLIILGLTLLIVNTQRGKACYLNGILLAVIAAGISNFLDRIARDGVIDVFSYGNFSWNIADMVIIGGIVLAIFAILHSVQEKTKERASF